MDFWTQLALFQWIETPSCYLRPVRMTDFEDFYDIVSHPGNTAFIFPSRENPEEVRYLMANSFIKAPLGIWAIASKDQDRFLGLIRLENINLTQGSAELGYFLHRDVWGQGLMTECVQTLADLALTTFGLRRLIIKTHEENVASQAVAKKAGFQPGNLYRASDRYSHAIRSYRDFYRVRGEERDE